MMMTFMITKMMMKAMTKRDANDRDVHLSISTAAAGKVSLVEREGVLHCAVPEHEHDDEAGDNDNDDDNSGGEEGSIAVQCTVPGSGVRLCR